MSKVKELAYKLAASISDIPRAERILRAELKELLDASAVVCNWLGDDSLECHKAHARLAAILKEWEEQP